MPTSRVRVGRISLRIFLSSSISQRPMAEWTGTSSPPSSFVKPVINISSRTLFIFAALVISPVGPSKLRTRLRRGCLTPPRLYGFGQCALQTGEVFVGVDGARGHVTRREDAPLGQCRRQNFSEGVVPRRTAGRVHAKVSGIACDREPTLGRRRRSKSGETGDNALATHLPRRPLLDAPQVFVNRQGRRHRGRLRRGGGREVDVNA